MSSKKVIIYTSPSCSYCHQLIDFLKENKIEFDQKDVTEDQKYADEAVNKSGQFGVPIVLIDEKVIVGFDKVAIEEALEI